jgi:hypothetical protein
VIQRREPAFQSSRVGFGRVDHEAHAVRVKVAGVKLDLGGEIIAAAAEAEAAMVEIEAVAVNDPQICGGRHHAEIRVRASAHPLVSAHAPALEVVAVNRQQI